jgi:hypothetical protein
MKNESGIMSDISLLAWMHSVSVLDSLYEWYEGTSSRLATKNTLYILAWLKARMAVV